MCTIFSFNFYQQITHQKLNSITQQTKQIQFIAHTCMHVHVWGVTMVTTILKTK